MLFLIWVASIYVIRELVINSTTLRMGKIITGLIAGVLVLGVTTILSSYLLPVNTWKVYGLLLMVMLIGVGIMWITARGVLSILSHKIPTDYRAGSVKREDSTLFYGVGFSIIALGIILTMNDVGVSVLMFLFLPIFIVIERVVAVKNLMRDVKPFDLYTEEEYEKSEARLVKGIEDGVIFKNKDNFVMRKVKKYQESRKKMREYQQARRDSEVMLQVAKKNAEDADNSEEEEYTKANGGSSNGNREDGDKG